MAPDKVKLSLESKRTFLEFGLKRFLDEQWPVSEEQMRSLMFNFVKMLCISNAYLQCSCRTYLDIYRLNLRFDQDSDEIGVSLTSKCYEFHDSTNDVFLTYDSVRKLIKLLLPSHIGVSFNGTITNVIFERCLELLNFTKEKIGFKLSLDDQLVQRLLEEFSTRIYEFFCPMPHFDVVESLEFPIFDRLVVNSISNSKEVSQVLRALNCKAKEWGLDFAFQIFTIDDNDLDDLKNETVKKLKLNFREVKCIKIKKLVEQLHASCFNLKHLIIDARFEHRNEFSNNQICDQIVAYVNRIKDLKTRFENGLASMHINFGIGIEVFGQHDNTWTNAITDKPEFKDWQFELYEEKLNGFRYFDWLKMIFDDDRCHLEMTFGVFTYAEQAEDED